MIRWVAAGFAVLFTLVVAMGYVPSFVTAVHGEDRILFDLFKISLLDDVTHAGTAVAALVAAATSTRASTSIGRPWSTTSPDSTRCPWRA